MFLVVTSLIIELIFFCMGVVYLYKEDKPFAFYFGALYLYGTPALIGYYFFPSLSKKLSAYWGEEYWFEFYKFTVLSMISFFLFSLFFIKRLKKKSKPRRKLISFVNNGYLTFFTLLFIGACCGVQIVNMVVNAEYIGYMKSSTTNVLTAVSSILFQISVGSIIILYYFIRSRESVSIKYLFTYLIFALSIGTFLAYGVKSGNRHILLQIVLGIVFIEIELKKLNRRTLLIYVGLLLLVFMSFQSLRIARNRHLVEMSFSIENLLSNDYYPPAHVMYSAIRYEYVEPMEVLRSNLANSFVGLGVDYLQASIMKLIVSIRISRSASYAFYVFTEGFMFMGKWGFLYNGFVPGLLLYVWRRITNVKDKDYSMVLSAILVCYSIDFVRGQTSYFVRYLWLYLVPNMILYALLTGVKKKDDYGTFKKRSQN